MRNPSGFGDGRDSLLHPRRRANHARCGRSDGRAVQLRGPGNACSAGPPAAGTLIEAWASMKSFKPKDGTDPLPDPGGRNGETDFHGQKRSNATHASSTDSEARLYRKGARQGSQAVLHRTRADGDRSGRRPTDGKSRTGHRIVNATRLASKHASRRPQGDISTRPRVLALIANSRTRRSVTGPPRQAQY